MSGNSSSEYTCARFYVSTVSFSVLLLFNIVINWTVVAEPSLRRHARFVLLLQLLLSALVHMGTRTVFYYQIHLRARPPALACLVMIALLISSASNILLTLTLMALDRFCAVCHPLRYTASSACGRWPWLLGLLSWAVSLTIPISVLHQPGLSPWTPGECGREQLRTGELQRVLFICACTLVILYSYLRILMEGRRLGVLNRANRAGCRTIALHGTQLAVYILPNFVTFTLTNLHRRGVIQRDAKELSAVVSFAFFGAAQCVAPVVYGLRKEELLEQLGQRFPCCVRYLKSMLGWRHRHLHARQRTMTGQTIVSLEVPEAHQEADTQTQSRHMLM